MLSAVAWWEMSLRSSVQAVSCQNTQPWEQELLLFRIAVVSSQWRLPITLIRTINGNNWLLFCLAYHPADFCPALSSDLLCRFNS